MQITLVNYEFPGITENCGGGGQVTKKLHDGLWTAGHTPSLVTDERDGHYATFPVRSYNRLKARIEAEDPDVLHGHFSLPSSLLLPRVASAFDLPLIISVMGADIYDPTRYQLLRPAMDRLNEFLLPQADATVAMSTDMRHRAQSFGQPCSVIPGGIDPEAWQWRERDPPDTPKILTVARLVERKNLHTAAMAVQRLRQQGPAAEYRIVGTGPERAELEAEYGHHDWFELRGYVDDLQAEYDWADAFFLPSIHEGFGMVFLEALACGLPVVTSSVGGQTDIVDSSVGQLAPADNATLQAGALQSIIDDYASYQAATEGYVADNFHVDQMIRQYEGLYQEVAA